MYCKMTALETSLEIMRRFLFLFIVSLLLVGCSAKGIGQITKQEDLDHKVLCAKYLLIARDYLAKSDKEHTDMTIGIDQITTLNEIFYSQTRNSCLYTWDETTYYSDHSHTDRYGLSDALTGEDVLIRTTIGGGADSFKARMDFDDTVNQYRGNSSSSS